MNNKPYTDEEMKAARFAYEVKQAFADTRRFCSESLMVQDMKGRLVHFVWNPAQDKLDQAVKRQREAGLPVRLIIVKSRRVGFSTGVAGFIFKETPFVDGNPRSSSLTRKGLSRIPSSRCTTASKSTTSPSWVRLPCLS